MATPKGSIMTISGPVKVDCLGIILPHEHLASNFEGIFCNAVSMPDSNMPECSWTLDNLWWIRQYPYHHKNNVEFGDQSAQDAVLHDLKFFKKSGGGTIVDCSTPGICRIPEFMKRVASESGVNIVSGTGFYVASSQTESRLKLTTEEISNQMRTELFEGFNGTGMKCGIIGELGTSSPVHAFEKKVLRAAGELQEELGIPVNIHPGRDESSPNEAIRLLLEAGGKAEKTVMSHLDRTIMDDAKLSEFASIGCYCEFDLFGTEVSHYQLNPAVDMPSDAQRITKIKGLVEQGFRDRILISHDIHTKHRLMKFGGHGFSHIILNVVPKMLDRGFSKELVDQIIVHNPQNWLAYN